MNSANWRTHVAALFELARFLEQTLTLNGARYRTSLYRTNSKHVTHNNRQRSTLLLVILLTIPSTFSPAGNMTCSRKSKVIHETFRNSLNVWDNWVIGFIRSITFCGWWNQRSWLKYKCIREIMFFGLVNDSLFLIIYFWKIDLCITNGNIVLKLYIFSFRFSIFRWKFETDVMLMWNIRNWPMSDIDIGKEKFCWQT